MGQLYFQWAEQEGQGKHLDTTDRLPAGHRNECRSDWFVQIKHVTSYIPAV